MTQSVQHGDSELHDDFNEVKRTIDESRKARIKFSLSALHSRDELVPALDKGCMIAEWTPTVTGMRWIVVSGGLLVSFVYGNVLATMRLEEERSGAQCCTSQVLFERKTE